MTRLPKPARGFDKTHVRCAIIIHKLTHSDFHYWFYVVIHTALIVLHLYGKELHALSILAMYMIALISELYTTLLITCWWCLSVNFVGAAVVHYMSRLSACCVVSLEHMMTSSYGKSFRVTGHLCG